MATLYVTMATLLNTTTSPITMMTLGLHWEAGEEKDQNFVSWIELQRRFQAAKM